LIEKAQGDWEHQRVLSYSILSASGGFIERPEGKNPFVWIGKVETAASYEVNREITHYGYGIMRQRIRISGELDLSLRVADSERRQRVKQTCSDRLEVVRPSTSRLKSATTLTVSLYCTKEREEKYAVATDF